MMFNPKPLIEAIKASMKIPEYIPGLGTPQSWPRPSLKTGMVLAGVSIDQYANVAPRKDQTYDELVEIAEQFIQIFVINKDDFEPEDGVKHSPCHWLRARMNLPREVDEWLFPVQVRKDVREDIWRYYTTLLWWISNAGHPIDFSPTKILVQMGEYQVGVVDGRIVSLVPEHCVKIDDAPDWQAYMTQELPGAAGRCKSIAWNRLFRAARYADETEKIQAALLVLYWRVQNRSRLENLIYEGRGNSGPPVMSARKVLKMANELEFLDDPYSLLRRTLVPLYMPVTAFNKLFKKPKSMDRPPLAETLAWKDTLYQQFNLHDYVLDMRKK